MGAAPGGGPWARLPEKPRGRPLQGICRRLAGGPLWGRPFRAPLGVRPLGAALGGGPWPRRPLGAALGRGSRRSLGGGPCRAFAGGLREAPFGGGLSGPPWGCGPWGRPLGAALLGRASRKSFGGGLCRAFAGGLREAPFGGGFPPWAALPGLCLGGLRGFPQSCFGSRWAAFNRIRFPLGCLGSHWAALVPTGLLGSFRAPMGFLVCSFSDLRGLVDVVYRRFGFIRWLAKIPLSFHGLPCLAFAFAFGRHRVCELGLARVM